MSNSQPYSTLEVHEGSQLPEVYDPEQFQKQAVPHIPADSGYTHSAYAPQAAYPPSAYPQAVYPSHAAVHPHAVVGTGPEHGHSPGSTYPDPSMYGGSPTYQGSSGMYEANSAKFGYAQDGSPSSQLTDEKKPPKRKICGCAPLTFWVILGVAIVVIIGVIAGAVGGTLASKNSNHSDPAGSNSSTSPGDSDSTKSGDDTPVLGGSTLTASNWTDPDGFIHRIVIFQDAYEAIVARLWDSQSNKWTTTNITKLLSPSTSPLTPVTGTPLASAAVDSKEMNLFEVHLWYLDSQGWMKSVACLKAVDALDTWSTDTLNDAQLQARPGSALAATWQRPWQDGNTGAWAVAYQRPSDGAIKVANSSHWTVSDVAAESDIVADNSSLAIIPQRNGARLDNLELITQGLGSGASGSMQLSQYNTEWDSGEGKNTNPEVLLDDISLPSKKQTLAMTMFNNWSQYLYLALMNDGTVEGSFYDGKAMNSIKPKFTGGPDRNFTAIATTTDAMLYAISNDEILEYSVDAKDPSNVNYIGKVFPA